MGKDNDPKSFWTTLPGFMTGLASLMTATVTVIAFLSNSARHAPPLEESVETQSAPSVPAQGDVCQDIVGNWNWLVGVIILEKGGDASWKQDPLNPVPAVTGLWRCVDASARQFTISWNNGFTDTVTLSPDGRTLSGANQKGFPVHVTRLG